MRISPTGKARRQPNAQYLAAVHSYESAVQQFQKGNFGKAAQHFDELARSPVREIADRARVHLKLCQQRLGSSAPPPKTAEEFYLRGIAELNGSRPEVAVEYLAKADKLARRKEHIQYALAAAHARAGNANVALEHLRLAIELRPQNRALAWNDEDFQSLADDPRFLRLINSGAA